jgi:hypothetical protein
VRNSRCLGKRTKLEIGFLLQALRQDERRVRELLKREIEWSR